MAQDKKLTSEPPSLFFPADATAVTAAAAAVAPKISEPSFSSAASKPGAAPPPIPEDARSKSAVRGAPGSASGAPANEPDQPAPARRAARRRPAGPPRGQVAANDDSPSIGGLIYALDQKPSNAPFKYAIIASVVWGVIGVGFSAAIFGSQYSAGAGLFAILAQPSTFLTAAAIVVPIAVLWFLALLAWRSEELRLRSSTMTEVAIRLAEPDRMAEQSVASLGQAVRRQVSFMNDAVSRALGRAGELEALVHNEVSALERSYEENERKIRGLIQELSGERHALLNTSERVTDTLKTLGTDVPALIEKLSTQQIKLATIIQSAGENLTSLEVAVGQSAGRLEHTLGERTDHLQNVLETYTGAIGTALGHRTEDIQNVLEGYTSALASALGSRSDQIQLVFEEYARALDTTLANRAENFDSHLVQRTKAIDEAFSNRLRLFDETILRSTLAIDGAVGDRTQAVTSALENHARTFSETIRLQTQELDEQLVQGISSVRRTSENITRQSLKAIENLAGQSDMLKNVSENLLGQINQVTNRFENQGQTIMRAANALETVNYKIDTTLQNRHTELSHTLEQLSGKADEFNRFVEGYSSTIEGSLSDAEGRARATAEQIRLGTETTKRTALADLERFKTETDAEGNRTLEELRSRFSNVSNAVSQQLDSLSSRVDLTSEEVRQRAARAAAEIHAEQTRLRQQLDQLPTATRESTETMRRALADQIKALDQLSALTARTAQNRDVSLPGNASLTAGYAKTADATRQTPPLPPSARPPAAEPREVWSLGDLLARASRDEETAQGAAPDGQAPAGFNLNVDVIARALEPATTSAIWSRLSAGQRGFMVRGMYSADGRILFDEISRRLRTDAALQRTVNRYLEDFDRIRRDSEQRDPSGRMAQTHLVSDTGRVYLFLAHAAGHLS